MKHFKVRNMTVEEGKLNDNNIRKNLFRALESL